MEIDAGSLNITAGRLPAAGADLVMRLQAQARRPQRARAVYDLGLMLLRWMLEHPGLTAAETFHHFQIERTRGLRAMRIAGMPEEILNAWSDRSTITVRGGARIASALGQGGAPARRLLLCAMAIVNEGGMQQPEARLLAAIDGSLRGWERMDCRLQDAGGNPVGRLRQGRLPDETLHLRLSAAAPAALKEEIVAMLRRHGVLSR